MIDSKQGYERRGFRCINYIELLTLCLLGTDTTEKIKFVYLMICNR